MPLEKLNEPEIFAKNPFSPSLLRSSTFTIASENIKEDKKIKKLSELYLVVATYTPAQSSGRDCLDKSLILSKIGCSIK